MAHEYDPESEPNSSPFNETNPFAPPETSNPDTPTLPPNQTSDLHQQLPPIKPSYVFAAGLSILFCFASMSLNSSTVLIGALGFAATPLAIARLIIHRKNIKRAIINRRFPGDVQFDGLYYLSSLAIACFAALAGILVFFGICLFLYYYDLGGISDFAAISIFATDAILAVITALFLIRLATPKYE